jgi:hypothetical protein
MEPTLAPTRARKPQNTNALKITWTPEEDVLLRSLVSDTQPNSWSLIAKQFPNKTAAQVSGRWDKVLNPGLVKGSWTREEDDVILDFVRENGVKDWAKLALMLKGRTGKQCRERFKNHLDPALLRNGWTEEEDQRLVDLHGQFGNQWTRIASFFDGRTDNCIKNRWNSTLKKRLERIQTGQPLVQKRGRKPKGLCQFPKPQLPSEEEDVEHSGTACTSPVIGLAGIQMVPLGVSQFSLLLPKLPPKEVKIASLAENRLDFQKMLDETS